ncbi:hypothetical protein BOX15_Mlig002074g3 [Macrostomum lignano]|uniref:Uncharacterized protein n=1 Tax=Macrostomum lignano TaxID=282301 RepID=A0A267DFJ7_9PLAT|nr:hypothetical protein BOX15_Mlig002074g3 [Macrostomum lignano]
MHQSRPPKRTDRSSSDERATAQRRQLFCPADAGPAIGAAAGQWESAPRPPWVQRVHPRLRLGQTPYSRSPSPPPNRRSPPPDRRRNDETPRSRDASRPRRRRGRGRHRQRRENSQPEVIDLTGEDSVTRIRRLRSSASHQSHDDPRVSSGPEAHRQRHPRRPVDPVTTARPSAAAPSHLPGGPTSFAAFAAAFGADGPTAGSSTPETLEPIASQPREDPPGKTAAAAAKLIVTGANRAPTSVTMGTQTSEAEFSDANEITYSWSDLAEELRLALPQAPPNSPAEPRCIDAATQAEGPSRADAYIQAANPHDADLQPTPSVPISLAHTVAEHLAGCFVAAAQDGEWPSFNEPIWAEMRALDDIERQAAMDHGADIAGAAVRHPEHPAVLRAVARRIARVMAGRVPDLPDRIAQATWP